MNIPTDRIHAHPHLVTVYPATETPDPTTLAVSVPAFGTGSVVSGQLTPRTPGAVYQSHGVMLEQPHLLLIDTADVSKFRVGYKVVLGTRVFFVRTHPAYYDTDPDGAAGITNHASMVLDEARSVE